MSAPKSPVRLLHLEDNPRAAQLVQERLASQGLACSIVQVGCRSQFETVVARNEFDLVLCDYNMPRYDGIAALKRVHRVQPEVPVIFMSGSMGDDPSEKCRSLGAADYLLKYRLERLVPAMKRVLREAAERRKLRASAQAMVEAVSSPLRHGDIPCAVAA